jgi:negative regulator of flagellin synthesis FlgM
MINSVGQNLGAAIEAARLRETSQARPFAPLGGTPGARKGSEIATPAARLAAEGAPVDMDRIAAIKSAIASGNYPVNPDAIAERMLALDLPA